MAYAILWRPVSPHWGTIPVDQCETLYLALEDQESRLNPKLSKIRSGNPATNQVHFAFRWPRMDAGGLESLAEWLKKYPTVKLVVIDTFTRFRPLRSNGTYGKDYDEISLIKKAGRSEFSGNPADPSSEEGFR